MTLSSHDKVSLFVTLQIFLGGMEKNSIVKVMICFNKTYPLPVYIIEINHTVEKIMFFQNKSA